MEISIEDIKTTQTAQKEPSMFREQFILKEGKYSKDYAFKLDVPKGEYRKAVIKVIITEASEDEYNASQSE